MSRQQTRTRIKGYQAIHAKQRAAERFGLNLTGDDYKEILASINGGGGAIPFKKLTNTRTIFKVMFKGKELYALYNSTTKRIVTFLTDEQIESKTCYGGGNT